MESDAAFFTRRAREERFAATKAEHPKARKAHLEMAARYGLTDEEVAAGYVLTCQSVPVGEGVAVDYDA